MAQCLGQSCFSDSLYDTLALNMACPPELVLSDYRMRSVMLNI